MRIPMSPFKSFAGAFRASRPLAPVMAGIREGSQTPLSRVAGSSFRRLKRATMRGLRAYDMAAYRGIRRTAGRVPTRSQFALGHMKYGMAGGAIAGGGTGAVTAAFSDDRSIVQGTIRGAARGAILGGAVMGARGYKMAPVRPKVRPLRPPRS